MIKILGVLLFLSLAAGSAVAVFTFQLSERLDDQDAQIERLRDELAVLRERSVAAEREVAGIAPGAFDLAGSIPADGAAAPTAGEIVAADTQGNLIGTLVRDDRVVAELARRLDGRVEPGASFLASPEFKEAFRTTLDEVREEERAAQAEEREARMLERTQDRARRIAERLALTPAAADELSEILVGQIESRRDVFALVESGQIPREEVRQVMREQREETDARLQTLLTPAQYTEYRKIEEEMGPERGGGRGPGGFFGDAAPVPLPPATPGGAVPATGAP